MNIGYVQLLRIVESVKLLSLSHILSVIRNRLQQCLEAFDVIYVTNNHYFFNKTASTEVMFQNITFTEIALSRAHHVVVKSPKTVFFNAVICCSCGFHIIMFHPSTTTYHSTISSPE